MAYKTKFSFSSLFLLLPFCLMVTGLPTEPNNKAEADNSSNATKIVSSTLSPIISSSPDIGNDESSAAQPRKITQSQKTTRERIPFITEIIDYDNYEDEPDDSYNKDFTLPPQIPAEPCSYDGCKHLERPCSEIQRSTGGKCLCPGISGKTVPPDAPRLSIVTPGQTDISINWCSPLSTVRAYRVVYGDPEGPLEMGPLLNQSHRFYSISNLAPGTQYRICVVAINDAGESKVEKTDGEEASPSQGGQLGPCGLFTTADSNGSYIYLGVGVGLAALAVVLGAFALFYWLRGRKKQRKIRRAFGEGLGVTNMSFKAESVENL